MQAYIYQLFETRQFERANCVLTIHFRADSTYKAAGCITRSGGTTGGSYQRNSKPDSDARVSNVSNPDTTAQTASNSPGVSVDQLQPGTPISELSDQAFQELVAEMIDGPGKVHSIMEMFGLSKAKDTWVGNAMVPGLSGGERKRLSTVELLQGSHQVLLLDEISTGLVRMLCCLWRYLALSRLSLRAFLIAHNGGHQTILVWYYYAAVISMYCT